MSGKARTDNREEPTEKKSGAQEGGQEGAGALAAAVGVSTPGTGAESGQAAKEPLVDEKKLAALIGVRTRHVVRWRKENAAYGACRGGRVGLTAEGAEKCAKMFTTKKIALASIALEPLGVSVTVFLLPGNERVLLCKRIDTDELVTVGVRDNRPYRIGDEFAAEILSDGSLVKTGDWPERGW